MQHVTDDEHDGHADLDRVRPRARACNPHMGLSWYWPAPGSGQSLHIVAHEDASFFWSLSFLHWSLSSSLVTTQLDAWTERLSILLSAFFTVTPSIMIRPVSVFTSVTFPSSPIIAASPRTIFTVSPLTTLTERLPTSSASSLLRCEETVFPFTCVGALYRAFLCFLACLLFSILPPQIIVAAVAAIRGLLSAASLATAPFMLSLIH